MKTVETVPTPPAMSTRAKFGIGAGAGFCLSLVKLLEVNFYIGQTPPVILGGALTVLAFGLVAALYTAFGTDERETGKLFMQGLLAPSLVIALVHRGADATATTTPDPSIPTLGAISELLMPSLHAQAPASPRAEVQTLRADRFNGSAADGALMLLGRAPARASYVYVVGKTASESEAQAAAAKVRKAVQASGSRDQVQIFKPEGATDFLVTVGGFQTETQATATRRELVKAVAAQTSDQSTLKLLINGPIVDGRGLVK
jgi:hypothetical protein